LAARGGSLENEAILLQRRRRRWWRVRRRSKHVRRRGGKQSRTGSQTCQYPPEMPGQGSAPSKTR